MISRDFEQEWIEYLMLTPPDLSPDAIREFLREMWGLRVREATFLAIGADANAFVFRVETADGAAYFLKLRRGPFDTVTVEVPAFLHDHGIGAVMAPILTQAGALWASGRGFEWLLYPFFDGQNGFDTPLSEAQWVTLGQSLRAVHAAAAPSELARRIPVEDYSARWREITLDFDAQVDASALEGEPVSARLSALWREKRAIILDLVERSDALARLMALRDLPYVLCHTDLHAGNVLLGAQGDLAIVDWDAPLLAPKERDLMFIGGGIGGVWTQPAESAAFYRGYGPTEIDALAMAYYRIERIVVDIAEYGMQIFGVQGSVEDREVGLERLIGLFNPNPVLESANQSYHNYLHGA